MDQIVDRKRYEVIEDRNNSDYVYLAENLINLSGNKFHRKKNFVNQFIKNQQFEYRDLDASMVCLFLELQEAWCELKDCSEDESLIHEDWAVFAALKHHEELNFTGGGILINGKVEAFALGEMLNPDTAVIHIEKANPDIPGLGRGHQPVVLRERVVPTRPTSTANRTSASKASERPSSPTTRITWWKSSRWFRRNETLGLERS